jgi:hypothetical protein
MGDEGGLGDFAHALMSQSRAVDSLSRSDIITAKVNPMKSVKSMLACMCTKRRRTSRV